MKINQITLNHELIMKTILQHPIHTHRSSNSTRVHRALGFVSLAICLCFITGGASNLFGLGSDGGGNTGGGLTNNPPGTFPPESGCLITDFEGLSPSPNGRFVFRRPNFSGSTLGLLDLQFADSSRISWDFAHSGTNSLQIQWRFSPDAPSPHWLRLTTFQGGNVSAVFPNPAVNLNSAIRFWIYVPSNTPDFYLSAGLRETGSTVGCGENGGTVGAIEWVGATTVRGTSSLAPLGKLISVKDQWVKVTFALPHEWVISFVGGNGVLNGAQGVLEHLAFTPVNDAEVGPFTVYLDDLAFDSTTPPPPAPNQKWTLTSAPTANWGAAAVSADGTRLVAVVQNGPIYLSSDAGRTWTPTSAPTNLLWSAVASSADGSTLVAAAFPGPIYISRNSGATWMRSSAPTNYYWAWVACSSDGSKVAAVPYYDGPITAAIAAAKSEEDPEVAGFSVPDGISDGIFLPPGFQLPPFFLPPTPKPIYLSSNAGVTWTAVEPLGYRIPYYSAFFWTSVAMSPDGSKLAVTGIEYNSVYPSLGWYGHVYTSANGGGTWQGSLLYSFPWNWVAMSDDGTEMLIAGGLVGTSSDAGTSWYNSYLPPGAWLAVATSADGTRMTASEYPYAPYPGRLASSLDSGSTWTVDNVPHAAWNGIAMSADGSLSVAVAYGGGIWVSRIVPVILTQPADLYRTTGDTAQFAVVAESSIGPEYQWLFNGQPLPNQTNATLVLPAVQPIDTGAYSVVVSNVAGSVISSTAFLVVNTPPIADASATQPLWISGNNQNAMVALDGSRSSDRDGDPLTCLWLLVVPEPGGGGPTNQPSIVLATNVIAVVALPVGNNVIHLVVDDGMAKDTDTITVAVLTTAEAVERLMTSVNESSHSPKQPLLATLNAALASLQRGNAISAVNQLLAFQNQVHAQVAPLDSDLAASLRQSAQQILDALTGGRTNPGGRLQGRFTSATSQPGGPMRLRFSAPPANLYVVEASTNLADWEIIGVAHLDAEGYWGLEDANAAKFAHRFYRIREP